MIYQKFPCIKVEFVITAQASVSGTAIYEECRSYLNRQYLFRQMFFYVFHQIILLPIFHLIWYMIVHLHIPCQNYQHVNITYDGAIYGKDM